MRVLFKTYVSDHPSFTRVYVSRQNFALVHFKVCIFLYLFFAELIQCDSHDETTTASVILTTVTWKQGTFVTV